MSSILKFAASMASGVDNAFVSVNLLRKMDYTETGDVEDLDLSIKKKTSEMSRMSSKPNDEGRSAETTNENPCAEEDRVRIPNYKDEYSKEKMKPVDSTIHCPEPSTSSGITRKRKSHRFMRDDGRKFTKSETHNLVGNEKLQKETQPFKTSDYDDSFTGKNRHRKETATGGKKLALRCEICEKHFKYSSNLYRHKKIHKRKQHFPCEFCEKVFKRSDVLTGHIRTHTGERPYSCDLCPKTFSTSSVLIRHKDVHLQNRASYRCPECENSYSSRRSMNRHRKYHKKFNTKRSL
ncbi:hypothetical protein NPIL_121781 [Nephila pilipes]|uniref:C2H2-type domain-containing protein n=1 Tax=Nephila pilipes TaxID=299642 RepID=A0A8X6TSM9_NEPPI|nr:hypothetical protein NPIL_121781 [Nephila pilipes]